MTKLTDLQNHYQAKHELTEYPENSVVNFMFSKAGTEM